MSTISRENGPDDSLDERKFKVPSRIYGIPVMAATVGMMIGFIRGSRMSALRFLAENAHRAPTTIQGWYFYNKTKNYRVLLGGFKGGGRDALRLGAVGCGWVAFEEGWKSLSTIAGIPRLAEGKEVVAGGSTAGVVSAIYRLPRRMALRTVGLGLGVGVSVSLLRKAQEMLGKDITDGPLKS